MPAEKLDAVPFAILGEPVDFIPHVPPSNFRVRKKRNLDRTENFCKGENVSDDGSENREIHITGKLLGEEKNNLDKLADSDQPVEVTSPTWTGEARLSECEYEGPTGWDSSSGHYYFDYTLDLVALGPAIEQTSGVVTEPDQSLPPEEIMNAGNVILDTAEEIAEFDINNII